jgi:thiol-disulfide isomerase/thioredoxin
MIRAAALLAVLNACAPRLTGGAEAFRGSKVDWKAVDLKGAPVDLGALRGEVVLVDFWATWCEPCRFSMPHHEELHRAYGEKGLRVVGVSVDEDPRMIEPYAKELGVSFQLLWDKGGGETARRIGIQRLPTTLLLDRTGVVLHVFEGWFPSTAAQMERALAEMLATEPTQPRAAETK